MARNTRTFSDIDLNFSPHPITKDIVRKFDENAIKTSLRNLILLNHYEAPFNSAKGSGMREMMFEIPSPMLKTTMERMIDDMITNYEPRVEIVNDIQINFQPDGNAVSLSIEFKIINNPTPQIITVVLERSR